jgi:hypothetical protein
MASNIARTVSRLRPVRPRSPFYRLSAHRVPTLWVLYRGLLRASPSPIVCRPRYIVYIYPLPHDAGPLTHTTAVPRFSSSH